MSAKITRDEWEQEQFDAFKVQNPRPGFRYRCLNVNERNIARRKAKGYEIVQGNDEEKLCLNESTPIKKGVNLDTTQRFADVVLARIPEEKAKKIEAHNRHLIDRQSHMIVTDFHNEAGALGFNPRRDPTGHSTRYSGGLTQTAFDTANLTDSQFQNKYGFSKEEATTE